MITFSHLLLFVGYIKAALFSPTRPPPSLPTVACLSNTRREENAMKERCLISLFLFCLISDTVSFFFFGIWKPRFDGSEKKNDEHSFLKKKLNCVSTFDVRYLIL